MIQHGAPLRSGWLLGAFAAFAAGGLLIFALSRSAINLSPSLGVPAQSPRPVVRFSPPSAPSGAVAWEPHSAMDDLSPLFLPSDRNARLPTLPLREPGDGTLDAQPASFRFRETDASLLTNFPPATSVNGKPVSEATELDVLRADGAVPIASGFGRHSIVLGPTPPRGALIEIFASGSGQVLDVSEIGEDSHPLWPQVWQPLEFLAAVDSGGLVSPLSLIVASRVDNVDTFFRDYLARTFRVGERLAPGFYRIVVSP